MLIQKKRVRQINLYLGSLVPQSRFVLATDLSQINEAKLRNSGFLDLSDGDILLPNVVGPVSRYNSEGKYEVHRNQPKERRFMGRREWTREEWDGPGRTRTVTESTDVYRDCYPRTLIPPPAVELTVVNNAGVKLIVSPPMTWRKDDDDSILHVINLMLELFGETELRHQNLASFTPPSTRRVNWSMLPPGVKMASGVVDHVRPIIDRLSPTFRGPAIERLTYLADLQPDEIYLGYGGFSGYVAYIFNKVNKAILESVMPDNATYVFGRNWQEMSRLTKSEVLAGDLHLDRILHTESWLVRVAAHTR